MTRGAEMPRLRRLRSRARAGARALKRRSGGPALPAALLVASLVASLALDRAIEDERGVSKLVLGVGEGPAEPLQALPLAPVEIARDRAGPALPLVLSSRDAERYRRVFVAQEKADWAAADREIAALDDGLLLGHVLLERYLHPTRYRSRYEELRLWLLSYRDHPGAGRIYRLALRRKGPGEAEPARPAIPDHGLGTPLRPAVDPTEPMVARGEEALSGAERRLRASVSMLLDRGRVGAARRLVAEARERGGVSERAVGLAEVDLARALFLAGRDREALDRAEAGAHAGHDGAPLADWIAGLASWRLSEFARAAKHFAAITRAETVSPRDRAAGAYWAARAFRRLGREEAANDMLVRAAVQPYTFYGLLATQRLFGRLGLVARAPRLVASDARRLLDVPGARRAAALTQVGRRDLAAAELDALSDRVDADLARALLALAVALELPEIQFDLGHRLFPAGSPGFNAASYPVPPWRPAEGFEVDRALVYAVMRRESRFRPGATSRAGARGLMQLMPSTASYLAGDRTLADANVAKLYDPGFNVDLGQRYLAELLRNPVVEKSLLRLAVAYNAGPARLKGWLDELDHRDDPLLFIEILPLAETRTYVRRVMANLWLYRARLGQPAPSLDALARGRWPRYTAHDLDALVVARYGQ